MMQTAQALYDFYSGFGVPAYTDDTVPDDAQPPYITYSAVETEWLTNATHYASVWSHSTSNAELLRIADSIKAAITPRANLKCEGGGVVIRPDTPLIQILVGDKPEYRRAYINMQINCYHE